MGQMLPWTLTYVLGLAAAMVTAVLLVASSRDGSIWVVQAYRFRKSGAKPNSFEPRHPPKDEFRTDGVRVRTEISYGTKYPNSHLDIWSYDLSHHVRRPTLVYVHGGGWFAGDKRWSDPFANGDAGRAPEPLAELAKAGFNVVNVNYALSPQYRYPVQIIQLNEAIGHLIAHAGGYGLDMGSVVIMGGSAGAHMTAQYGLLVSDPAYAAEVGIEPAIDASGVIALVLYSPLLKFSGFSWRRNAMLWGYLGTKNLESSGRALQVDILSHIGPRYPASYITDGNQPDTFPEHAKAMVRILSQLNIDHVFNFYAASEAPLGHTYTSDMDSKYAQDNLRKTIEFVRLRTDRAPASD
jgi:acetyl esterase/lipase